uniref:G_PROTEIN_RECEP_F1_2 domain-containing protein n=1 Tax=Panagrellus redivivus TaxID=6233 RepID=A0A7E4VTC3_PANRE
MPIMATSRSLWIVQRISIGTWLSAENSQIVDHFVNVGLISLWFMQIPCIAERICATIFYKTYLHWKSWGTLLLILACIYVYLFRVNIRRYRNGMGKQNLRERCQVFENMQSLLPLFWTVGIEMVYNIGSIACTVIRIDYITNQTSPGFDIFDGIKNTLREILFVLYCFPFLIYSDQRRRTRFLNKVSLEIKNVNILYFKQLQDQW